jgi:hypothetical protein
MAVPAVNLTIDRGTDFEKTFKVKDSDGSSFALNNFEATALVRKHPSAKVYESFSTSIVPDKGEITISMDSDTTLYLNSGRNYYDVIITQLQSNKIKKVFEGSIIVSDTASVIKPDSRPGGVLVPAKFSDLEDFDASNLSNNYLIMYDAATQTYKAVNPDEILSKAVTEPISPGLPAVFVDKLDVDLDDKINLDAGGF